MKLKYLSFVFRLIYLKFKYSSRIIFKSLKVGIESRVIIVIRGPKSKLILNKMVYLMRYGNLEVYDDGEIEIGNNVSINKNFSIISREKIKIGNNVSIGPNCCIYDHDHDFSKKEVLIRNQGYKSKGIIIEDDVWIASNVYIGKGIKIGKGSIVGAGSVVVNDVKENTIVAGIPAKKIKERF